MIQALSKSQHLNEQLMDELAAANTVAGQRFYSIPEVSERYQVSVGTAHKVVSALVKQGFLRSHRGKGYFVHRKPSQSQRPMRASAVATARTLLLINDFGSVPPPPKIMAGVQDACTAAHYRLEIVAHDSPYVHQIVARPDVAGLLFTVDRVLTWVKDVDKPKFCIGHWFGPDDGVVSFVADAEDAGVQMIRHLCGLGHKRITMLASDAQLSASVFFYNQFIAGMRRGLQMYGLERQEVPLYVDLNKPEAEMVDQFVRTFRQNEVTAVFVPVWSTLLRLTNTLRDHSIVVPRDLSIMAYGEDPLTPYMTPAMTSFDLFIRRIAQQAAQKLIDVDTQQAPMPSSRFITSPVELTVRQSTAMLSEIKYL